MKQYLIDFFTTHIEALEEIGIAILVIMAATGIKFWKAIQSGLKPSFKWFLGESFMSGIVGITGYYFFDRYLHLDKVLVCILCVWLGSASTVFSKKIEDLVEFLFEKAKALISAKTPMIIILSLLVVSSVSCSRKTLQSTHTIERIIEHKKDSTSSKEISKAIIDSLIIKINQIKTAKPECDSITNAEIQKLLRQIQTLKKSGNNELGFYYDEINKQLVAYGKIDESIKESLRLSEANNTTSKDSQIIEIPVKYIPKWIQILALIGFLAIIYILINVYIKVVAWRNRLVLK